MIHWSIVKKIIRKYNEFGGGKGDVLVTLNRNTQIKITVRKSSVRLSIFDYTHDHVGRGCVVLQFGEDSKAMPIMNVLSYSSHNQCSDELSLSDISLSMSRLLKVSSKICREFELNAELRKHFVESILLTSQLS